MSKTEELRQLLREIMARTIKVRETVYGEKEYYFADDMLDQLLLLLKDHCYLKGEQKKPKNPHKIEELRIVYDVSQKEMIKAKFWPVQEIEARND